MADYSQVKAEKEEFFVYTLEGRNDRGCSFSNSPGKTEQLPVMPCAQMIVSPSLRHDDKCLYIL